MISVYQFMFAGSAIAALLAATANASEVWSKEDQPSKWRVSFSTLYTSSDIEVIDNQVEIPEDFIIEDLEVETTQTMNINATALTASVGYRILPILEVAGRAGFINSEVDTQYRLTGNLNGPLELFSGPIDITTDAGREVDGYTLGFTVAGALPVTKVRDRGLALFTAYSANWNSLDSGDVFSTAVRTAVGLAYPADRDAHDDITYTVGASYNWLEREVEQTASIGGVDVGLIVEQEFVEPWSLDAGVRIPINANFAFGFGVSHSMSGATSGFLNLSIQPGSDQ